MANENAGRIVILGGEVGAGVDGDHRHAEIAKLVQDHLTDKQITGKAVGTLDEHSADAIRAYAPDEIAEPLTIVEFAGSTHALVAVLADDLDVMRPRIAMDGVALTRKAVSVDLATTRDAQVR